MAAGLPKFDRLRDYIEQAVVARLQPLAYGHVSLVELLTPVRDWVDKLEEWSKARLRELEEAEKALAETRGQLEHYERASVEDGSVKEDYDELVGAVRDFDRGLLDWREVQDLLPSPLGVRPDINKEGSP
jgi:hypothetical protein